MMRPLTHNNLPVLLVGADLVSGPHLTIGCSASDEDEDPGHSLGSRLVLLVLVPVPVAVAGGSRALGVLSLASQEWEVVVVELVLDGLLHNVFHLDKSYEQGNVNGSVSPSESIWTSDMCSRLGHLVVNLFLRNLL